MGDARYRFSNDLRYRGDEHPNQVQLTPEYALEPIRAALGGRIELDPCTEADNPTRAERFFTVRDDGMAQSWDAESIFVNPPYSAAKDRWVERCMAEGERGAKVVLLIPAHPDTRVFQRVLRSAHAVVFVKGRLKFGVKRDNGRQKAASHGSAILVWNCNTEPLEVLGTVVPLRPSTPLRYTGGSQASTLAWKRLDGTYTSDVESLDKKG